MQRADKGRYAEYVDYANEIDFGAVYPRSIAEGVQRGEILIENSDGGQGVLFWHYCGFAAAAGYTDEGFYESVYSLMAEENAEFKRLILFTDDRCAENFFAQKDDITIERRCFFEYKESAPLYDAGLPDGYEIREIDAELLSGLTGRIAPSFS